ncbi:hypothetical protein M9Y10_039767 [Tritrichomonas musculus]|uniref:Uncharacterized protein n=1 Tax=Tritrichomonas musculus TaxID=1915356 RepID=A0ABR2GR69_9EUKA
MPRLGFKNNRIKAIIYHTNKNPVLDVPIIYRLDDGKHICDMPRSPRTNYRKKERFRYGSTKGRFPMKKVSGTLKKKSTIISSPASSSFATSFCMDEKKCLNFKIPDEQKNNSDDKDHNTELSKSDQNEIYSDLFEIISQQLNSDTFLSISDLDE